MFEYPNKLNNIFDKLEKLDIKPIIIGGYVRDYLLQIPSKDIDIEIYGISSFNKLEIILSEFGNVNSVGKSFGVCKLHLDDLDLDFSLPRKDSKNNAGHKGFEVIINPKLDFKTATSRRDFTINAIGYDVIKKQFIDPFHGKKDLDAKILKAVDIGKFKEDPLRVLRAVGFATRLYFKIDKKLFNLLKEMIQNRMLDELPKERIFTEIEKFLLKAKQPSYAFSLLKKLHAQTYFLELYTLNSKDYNSTMNSLDRCQEKKIDLLLAILVHKMKNPKKFLLSLTENKKLIDTVLLLVSNQNSINLKSFSTYDVYKLATQVNITQLLPFLKMIKDDSLKLQIDTLEKIAKDLGVASEKLKPFIEGKDLLKLGLKPSKKISIYLKMVYEAQMRKEVSSKEEALKWIKLIIFS